MDFENLTAIIDFAIEKEREAAAFYENISEKERFSGKKQMLKEFAGEERKHEKLLTDIKTTGVIPKVGDYKFKWITDIKRSDYTTELEYKEDMGYNEILMLAAQREEKALKLYNELLEQADSDEAKKVFKMLCQEEAKHKLALETLYDDYMAGMGD
ncbi:MAG: ferritin family protein [Desulfobacteraceae bacterium]|nr:ferritin family protein [Desulfobacteraceae bacterium]